MALKILIPVDNGLLTMKKVGLALALIMALALCVSAITLISASQQQSNVEEVDGVLSYYDYLDGIYKVYVTFLFKMEFEPTDVVYTPGGYIEVRIRDLKLGTLSGKIEPPVRLHDIKICTLNYKGDVVSVQGVPIAHEFSKMGEKWSEEIAFRIYYNLATFVDVKHEIPEEFTAEFWFCGGEAEVYNTRSKKRSGLGFLDATTSFSVHFIVPKTPMVSIDVQAPSEVSVGRPFEAIIRLKSSSESSVNLKDVIFTEVEDLSVKVLESGVGQLQPGQSTEFRLQITSASTGFKKVAFSIPYSYLGVIEGEFTGYISFNVVEITPQDAEEMIHELKKLKAELEPKLKDLRRLHEELISYSRKVDELYSLANQIKAKLKDLEQKYGELSQKVSITKTIQVTTTQTLTGKPSIPAGQPGSQTQQEILPKIGYNELLLMLLGATLTGVIIAIALAAVAIRRGGRK